MLIQQTTSLLHALKLFGFAEALEDQRNNPAFQDEPFEQRLGYLVEHEVNLREKKRLMRLRQQAKLNLPEAVPENINYSATRSLDKSQVLSLLACEWINRGQDLLITGPTGIGKSWLANSFANQAMRKGMTVNFRRFSRLMEEYDLARGDGTLPRVRARLAKVQLLLIDDWLGTKPILENVLELRELVEDRHGTGSLLITSQVPEGEWYERLGDPTHADGILDRLLSQPHRMPLRGKSLRTRHANQ